MSFATYHKTHFYGLGGVNDRWFLVFIFVNIKPSGMSVSFNNGIKSLISLEGKHCNQNAHLRGCHTERNHLDIFH